MKLISFLKEISIKKPKSINPNISYSSLNELREILSRLVDEGFIWSSTYPLADKTIHPYNIKFSVAQLASDPSGRIQINPRDKTLVKVIPKEFENDEEFIDEIKINDPRVKFPIWLNSTEQAQKDLLKLKNLGYKWANGEEINDTEIYDYTKDIDTPNQYFIDIVGDPSYKEIAWKGMILGNPHDLYGVEPRGSEPNNIYEIKVNNPTKYPFLYDDIGSVYINPDLFIPYYPQYRHSNKELPLIIAHDFDEDLDLHDGKYTFALLYMSPTDKNLKKFLKKFSGIDSKVKRKTTSATSQYTIPYNLMQASGVHSIFNISTHDYEDE